MKLILRELTALDETAFMQGLKTWEGEDLSWYSFLWTPGLKFSDMLVRLEKDKNWALTLLMRLLKS